MSSTPTYQATDPLIHAHGFTTFGNATSPKSVCALSQDPLASMVGGYDGWEFGTDEISPDGLEDESIESPMVNPNVDEWNYNNSELDFSNFAGNTFEETTQCSDILPDLSPQSTQLDTPNLSELPEAVGSHPYSYPAYRILSYEEELALLKIAMPSNKDSAIKRHTSTSTNSSTNEHTSVSIKPQPSTKTCSKSSAKRRKVTATASSTSLSSHTGDDEEMKPEYQTFLNRKMQQKKRGHNEIEKRYRTNLNGQILTLDQRLPQQISDVDVGISELQAAIIERRKATKSAILTGAVEHIGSLTGDTARLKLEKTVLNSKIASLEQLLEQFNAFGTSRVQRNSKPAGCRKGRVSSSILDKIIIANHSSILLAEEKKIQIC